MPEEADGLPQTASDLGILGGCQPWIVQLIEQSIAAPEREEQGPPTRLRGMGREHQAHRQLLQRGARTAERHARTTEHLDRFRDRTVEDALG